MFRHTIGLALIAALLPLTASGQGLLVNTQPGDVVPLPRPIIWPQPIPRPVPQPPTSYKIKELAVNAKIADQVARVQVSQSFVNTGSQQMEVCFVFPLPYDGAVDQLTLLVDGKEFEAKLLDAKDARSLYESIVRKNQDPALLEWLGAGLFKTSVFPVPAGAERTVTLKYSQLCRNRDGVVDFLFPLSTAKYTSHPVEKLAFNVAISSDEAIKSVYSPTHSIEIKRPDDEHATVTFESSNQIPSSDFRLLYDVGTGAIGAKVVSYRPDEGDEGYFLLLASPQIKAADSTRPAKTAVFVVDRSGSMSGKKMTQAKNALKFVLNNLEEGDFFNIVAYDSEIESFKPELQPYNDKTRAAALGFVEGIYAGGGTNIDGALKTALRQIAEQRPTYVIFMTDGLPTIGETNEMKIVANAKQQKSVRARIFSFGVGYDVNSRLLDKLSVAHHGQSHYVRPNEDIEDRVAKMYQKISSPVMTDVAIEFDMDGLKPEEGKPVSRVYPKKDYDLFAGDQLVVVGRFKKSGAAKVKVTGKVGEEERKFDFAANFVEKSDDESYAFVEKLWAVRRIGEIIDEVDLSGQNDELIKELVTLSIRHGIMTPYTSFMADEGQVANVNDLAANFGAVRRNLDALSEVSGAGAFAQRAAKGALKSAPRAAAIEHAEEQLFADADAPDLAGAPVAGRSGEAREKAKKRAEAVLRIGRKAFYRRGDRWVDGEIDKEMEEKVKKVERFSQEYFDLIDKHGKEVAKYLAIEGEVMLELDGQVYAF